jgi:hypothetical protein
MAITITCETKMEGQRKAKGHKAPRNQKKKRQKVSHSCGMKLFHPQPLHANRENLIVMGGLEQASCYFTHNPYMQIVKI